MARAHTESALNVLAGIMNQYEAPPAARVSAATALLDRGWGKPSQAITGDDELDPIRVIQEIRRTLVNPRDTDSEGVSSAT